MSAPEGEKGQWLPTYFLWLPTYFFSLPLDKLLNQPERPEKGKKRKGDESLPWQPPRSYPSCFQRCEP